jgi:hypothetical protein
MSSLGSRTVCAEYSRANWIDENVRLWMRTSSTMPPITRSAATLSSTSSRAPRRRNSDVMASETIASAPGSKLRLARASIATVLTSPRAFS